MAKTLSITTFEHASCLKNELIERDIANLEGRHLKNNISKRL